MLLCRYRLLRDNYFFYIETTQEVQIHIFDCSCVSLSMRDLAIVFLVFEVGVLYFVAVEEVRHLRAGG